MYSPSVRRKKRRLPRPRPMPRHCSRKAPARRRRPNRPKGLYEGLSARLIGRSMYWANLQSGLFPILIILVIFGGGALLERGQPAESGQPARNARFNVLYGVVSAGLRFGLTPALGILVTVLINALAGGWIALPSHGWPLVGSVILYVLVIDFLEFAFHRAQHVVPFLWAMHSFHHSDRAVNVSTAVRNYWLELPIKILFVYPVAAILFRVPPAVLAIYAGTTV